MWLKNGIASAFLSSKNHDKDLIALTRKKKMIYINFTDLLMLHFAPKHQKHTQQNKS